MNSPVAVTVTAAPLVLLALKPVTERELPSSFARRSAPEVRLASVMEESSSVDPESSARAVAAPTLITKDAEVALPAVSRTVKSKPPVAAVAPASKVRRALSMSACVKVSSTPRASPERERVPPAGAVSMV